MIQIQKQDLDLKVIFSFAIGFSRRSGKIWAIHYNTSQLQVTVIYSTTVKYSPLAPGKIQCPQKCLKSHVSLTDDANEHPSDPKAQALIETVPLPYISKFRVFYASSNDQKSRDIA
uniref:Uncharacterized protein n=1 Tax=Micrurus spixii TaxID=129469 RepID=A0A2D4NBR3_9SAUR